MTTTKSRTESIRGVRGGLGQGLYSLSELRAYLTLEGERKDGERALYWLTEALNPVEHRAKQPDYSFSDLISLFVVRELRKRNVPSNEIAKAEQWGRERFGIDRPFVRYDVATDGTDVCFEIDRDEKKPHSVESANRHGQRVLAEPIRDKLQSVRYTEGREGVAYEWVPMDGVVLDPTIQFGAPVIAGTRVLTDDAAAIADELGPEATAERLSVELSDIRAAISFQRRVAALQ